MNTVARISTWIAVLGIVGLALFVTLRAASANTGGVCDRTSQVGQCDRGGHWDRKLFGSLHG